MNAKEARADLQIAEELGYHPESGCHVPDDAAHKADPVYCKDMRNVFNIEGLPWNMAAGQQDYMVVEMVILIFEK